MQMEKIALKGGQNYEKNRQKRQILGKCRSEGQSNKINVFLKKEMTFSIA